MATGPDNDAGRGRVLTGIARNSIAAQLGADDIRPLPAREWLQQPGASFVTLHKHAALRGCIGSLSAHRPLGEDVRGNARSAAFHDPRFPPLSAGELADIDIEVSVLSAPEPLYPADESELLGLLRPGIDGLILEYGPHRSTFLPQVWEQLPDPQQFLVRLKLKGGLPADFWHRDMHMARYTVTAYEEEHGGES